MWGFLKMEIWDRVTTACLSGHSDIKHLIRQRLVVGGLLRSETTDHQLEETWGRRGLQVYQVSVSIHSRS